MKNISLKINGIMFDGLYVAENYQDMIDGLDNRMKIAENEGMIYVFNKDFTKVFTNKNPYCEIDLIMVDSSHEITAVHTMGRAAFDDDGVFQQVNYGSPCPCRYVFEFKAGTAEKYDWQVGDAFETDYTALMSFRNAANIRYAFQRKKITPETKWIPELLQKLEDFCAVPDPLRDLNIFFAGGKHDTKRLHASGWDELDGIDTMQSANFWFEKIFRHETGSICARVCLSIAGHFRYLYLRQLDKDGAFIQKNEEVNTDSLVKHLWKTFADSQIEPPPETLEIEKGNIIAERKNRIFQNNWSKEKNEFFIWGEELLKLAKKSPYYTFRLLNGMFRFGDFCHDDLILGICMNGATQQNYRWAMAKLAAMSLKYCADSSNPDFWNDLGCTLDMLEEKESAFHCFVRAWSLDFAEIYSKNLWLTGNKIIPSMLADKKWNSIYYTVSAMLAAIPDNAAIKEQLEILSLAGLVYEARGDYEEAEDYYNSAYDIYKRHNKDEDSPFVLRKEFPMLYQSLMRARMSSKTRRDEHLKAQLETFPRTPSEYGYNGNLPIEYTEDFPHGDHWTSVVTDEQLTADPEKFFGTMIEKGIRDFESDEIHEYERGQRFAVKCDGFKYSHANDKNSPLTGYFLISETEKSGRHEFVTGFPVFKKGCGSSIVRPLDNVNSRANGVEASVRFRTREDGSTLSFYLPDYQVKAEKLKKNTAYRIELGAFAYEVSKFERQEFKISEGPFFEEHKKRLRDEGEDDNIDSVSVYMENDFCTLSMSTNGWDDDIFMIAPIESIEKFTFLGNECLTLWLKFDERGGDMTLPVFLRTSQLKEGYEPQVGDVVSCTAWLQGWIHESRGVYKAQDTKGAEENKDTLPPLLETIKKSMQPDLRKLAVSALVQKCGAENICRCPDSLPGDADYSCLINGETKFVKVMTGYFDDEVEYLEEREEIISEIFPHADGKKIHTLFVAEVSFCEDYNKIHYDGFEDLCL